MTSKSKQIKETTKRHNIDLWVKNVPTIEQISIDEIAMDWQKRILDGMSTYKLFDETSRFIATNYFCDEIGYSDFINSHREYTKAFEVCGSSDDAYELSIQTLIKIGYK